MCLGDEGRALKPEGSGDPAQVISDEPEEPDYLKPPEVDKSGDFDRVSPCRVVESKLGYRIQPTGTKQVSVALNRLPSPVSGRVTLATEARVSQRQGFLTNVFVAFGEGPSEEELVKCGIRFKLQKALIVQGSLAQESQSQRVDVDAPYGKVIHLAVEVDLEKQRVALTAGGATVEAQLAKPIGQIRFVGLCTDSSVAEFSPVKVNVD
jgi:hypothetical protein